MRPVTRLTVFAMAAFSVACTTTTNNYGTSGSTATTGDSTKNTGSISATNKDGTSVSVKGSGSAGAGSTSGSSKNGASITGTTLNIYLSDSNGMVSILIDTSKHPLPATGIKAGTLADGALVTYVGEAGSFGSDGSGGTIDITACPANAANQVAVGVLHGVICSGVTATGPGTYTLDGSFNAVIDGGFGSIQCTPPAATTTADAGSTSDTGTTGGGTCGFTACTDTTAHCCPFMPCMDPCESDCFNANFDCNNQCMMNAGAGDPGTCMSKCNDTLATCADGCFTKCKVTDACKSALVPLNKCRATADGGTCKDKKDADLQSCELDQCCSEAKAAF